MNARLLLAAALCPSLLIQSCNHQQRSTQNHYPASKEKPEARAEIQEMQLPQEDYDKAFAWPEEQNKAKASASQKFTPPVVNYDRKEKETITDQSLVQPDFNTEDYDNIVENEFVKAAQKPLSTFSVDVDRASYANMRRYIQGGSLPPKGAVRIEELINYFDYSYPQPVGEHPFSFTTELGNCPWNPQHYLLQIGMQGRKVDAEKLPPANLVFLIDVSGSMQDVNKLPLVQSSLNLLANNLRAADKVSIVVYAGAAGLVLPATPGNNPQVIRDAISRLSAGGSTAGGEGIRLAYATAKQNFIAGGNNRVILCTDGDFNVGPSSDDELVRMIEEERNSGVYLTVLGYGMGNYKDNKMQQLADKGNGNHAYIDNLSEARKVLLEEFGGTLFAIAKDVKLQMEFNPAQVQAYRLVGYENRILADEDFNDDTKDAGEIGAGHTVTALYEIIPVGVSSSFLRAVDSLKYQAPNKLQASKADEMLTIKFRYKLPDQHTSRLLQHAVPFLITDKARLSDNFNFAAAVAEFGLLLRQSKFKQQASMQQVVELANRSRSNDAGGYKAEFISLVHKADALMKAVAARQ